MLRFLFHIFLLAWFGLFTAAAVQSYRPAAWAEATPVSESAGKTPANALMDRMEQTLFKRNAPLVVTEEEVNRHLASVLHGRQVGASASVATFSRITLAFEKDMATLRLVWGNPGGRISTASLDFTVVRKGGDFVIEVQRGSLGRLPVPRGIMCTLLPGLDSLVQSLRPEIHSVFQMNQIRFEKDKVVFDPRSDTVK